MPTKFDGLLNEISSEIARLVPSDIVQFNIIVPKANEVARKFHDHPFSASISAGEVVQVVRNAYEHLTSANLRLHEAEDANDPVGMVIASCILDALMADHGLVSLAPCPGEDRTFADILAANFTERQARKGSRYFASNRGARPVLIVSATGTPGDIWRRFLADPEHDLKILFAENQTGSLRDGGLEKYADIATEVDGLVSILETEKIDQIDVIAWCNGARVAIDFAVRHHDRVSSLILLAPQLRGHIEGVPPNPSAFEKDLGIMLKELSNRPEIAPFVTKSIAQSISRAPDWDRFSGDLRARAEALFGQSGAHLRKVVIAPFRSPESVLYLAQRVASDEAYPMSEALSRLRMPLLAIAGDSDRIVNNAFMKAALTKWARAGVLVTLAGTGHYIQDLQYHYFRSLLAQFLGSRQIPKGMARASVLSWGQPE